MAKAYPSKPINSFHNAKNMKTGKRRPVERFIAFLLGVFFFVLLWWLLSLWMEGEGLHYLPDPWRIFGRVGELLFQSGALKTYAAFGYTFLKMLIGFAFSFLLAGMLGTIGALFPLFASFEKSHILLFRSVPTAGIALLLGTAFWLELPSWHPFIPSILTFLVAFPILYQAFLDGIVSIPSEEKDALRLDGAERKMKTVYSIYWPDASGYIGLGLSQAFGLSFKVTIMSEIVTNSGTSKMEGIGTLIGKAIQENADLNLAIAYSLIAVLAVFLADGLLLLTKSVLKAKTLKGD